MKSSKVTTSITLCLLLTGFVLILSSYTQLWVLGVGALFCHLLSAILLFLVLFPIAQSHSKYRQLTSKKAIAGSIVTLFLGLAIISGIILFYLGARWAVPTIHTVFGFSLVLLLLSHLGLHKPRNTRAIRVISYILPLLVVCAGGLIILIPAQRQSITGKSLSKSQKIPFTDITLVNLPPYDKDRMAPENCTNCHQEIYSQWKQSLHAVADGEILYARVVSKFRADYGVAASNWCAGCHSPLRVGREQLNLKLADVSQPNVECITCHSISEVHKPIGNNNFSLNVQEPRDTPVDVSRLGLANRLLLLQPGLHQSRWNRELLKKPEFCGGCHNQEIPEFIYKSRNPIQIQSTYKEWENSFYNNSSDFALRKTCQDCHMPLSESTYSLFGERLRSHYFAGGAVDISRLNGSRDAQKKQQSLLAMAAAINSSITNCQKDKVDLTVSVTNTGAGHNLPTGVSDLREMWLEVTVIDAENKVIYQSGGINSDGFLDAQAVKFGTILGDSENKPVLLHDIAQVRQILTDTTIPAGETKTSNYSLPLPSFDKGKISVRLLYRSVPQGFLNFYMTRDLRFQIVQMAETTFNLKDTPQCTMSNT